MVKITEMPEATGGDYVVVVDGGLVKKRAVEGLAGDAAATAIAIASEHATVAGERADIAAARAKVAVDTRNLYVGYLKELTRLDNRIANLENAGLANKTALAKLGSITAGGSQMVLNVAAALAGGTLDTSKMWIRGWRAGFENSGTDGQYDASIGATFHEDIIPFTKAVTQVAPSDTVADAPVDGNALLLKAWFADPLCAADSSPGLEPQLVLEKGWYTNGPTIAPAQTLTLTNNSTKVAPKPGTNLITEHRAIVGSSIYFEIEAFQYFARRKQQVAAIEVKCTDGTKSVYKTVYAMTVSPRATDKAAVLAFCGTIDITELTNQHLVTLTWRAIPWIGTAACIFDSAGGPVGTRDAGPRFFHKDTALAATRRRVYVNDSGNDATAYVGTDDTLARASPAFTPQGAMTRTMTLFGDLSGVECRAGTGTWVLAATVGQNDQVNAAFVFTSDPLVPASGVIYQLDATFNAKIRSTNLAAPITHTAIRFTRCRFERKTGTSSNLSNSLAPMNLFWDVEQFENSSIAIKYLSGTIQDWWYGGKFLNPTNAALTAGAERHCLWRGLEVTGASTASPINIEVSYTTGCLFTRAIMVATSSVPISNIFIAFNYFRDCGDANFINIGRTTGGALYTLSHFFVCQNLFERLTAVENCNLRVSADDFLNNLDHYVETNNTFIGAYLNGRNNGPYDETTGFPRQHQWVRLANNIVVLRAVKSNYFMYNIPLPDGDPANAYRHVGNWETVNGVGVRDEWSMFTMTFNARPQHYGPGSQHGALYFTRLDPGFVDYRGVTVTGVEATGNGVIYTAGSAGGNYRIKPELDGGAARSIKAEALFPFALDGAARSVPDCVGCFS